MKLKPDYLTGGSETFDCVIIGGNYGKGKRSGLITQYIVAVIDDFELGSKPTVWVFSPEDHTLWFCYVTILVAWAQTFFGSCRVRCYPGMMVGFAISLRTSGSGALRKSERV